MGCSMGKWRTCANEMQPAHRTELKAAAWELPSAMAACIPRAWPWGAVPGTAPLWTRLGTAQVGARGAAPRQRPPAARILRSAVGGSARRAATSPRNAAKKKGKFYDAKNTNLRGCLLAACGGRYASDWFKGLRVAVTDS